MGRAFVVGLFLALGWLAVSPGCRRGAEWERFGYAETPMGYLVSWEGSADVPAAILAAFDAELDREAHELAARYPEHVQLAQLYAIADGARFVLWAGRDPHIGPWSAQLGRYPSGSVKSLSPAVIYLAWSIPESTQAVAALDHELGHVWAWRHVGELEGVYFEHGWKPTTGWVRP